MSDHPEAPIVKQFGIWHVDEDCRLIARNEMQTFYRIAPRDLTGESPWYPHLERKTWNRGYQQDFLSAYRFALDRYGRHDFEIPLYYPGSRRILKETPLTWIAEK